MEQNRRGEPRCASLYSTIFSNACTSASEQASEQKSMCTGTGYVCMCECALHAHCTTAQRALRSSFDICAAASLLASSRSLGSSPKCEDRILQMLAVNAATSTTCSFSHICNLELLRCAFRILEALVVCLDVLGNCSGGSSGAMVCLS